MMGTPHDDPERPMPCESAVHSQARLADLGLVLRHYASGRAPGFTILAPPHDALRHELPRRSRRFTPDEPAAEAETGSCEGRAQCRLALAIRYQIRIIRRDLTDRLHRQSQQKKQVLGDIP